MVKKVNNHFSVEMFTVSKQNKLLIAEMSDLKLDGLPYVITIRNPKTGNTVSFNLFKEVMNADNEFTHAIYTPMKGNGYEMNQKLKGWTVQILND